MKPENRACVQTEARMWPQKETEQWGELYLSLGLVVLTVLSL